MRVIDLFCGIGGFRLGLEKSNRQQQEDAEISRCGDSGIPKVTKPNQSKVRRNYFSCVWSNDNDKYACLIYRKHWGDGELYEGDIFEIQASAIPDHDLICAGFPCQSFSIAGKRGGFQDTRGTLFYEICRIAEAKRTPYLFLENVKGLLNHDGGQTFWEILSTLDVLGYDCQWQVLNSKNYGVPQNRERVFIIGHLRGQPRPKVFPIGEANEGIDEGTDEATNIRTLQGGGHSGGHHSRMTLLHTAYPDGNREYKDISPTISTPSGGGYLPFVAQRWARTEKGRIARRESQKLGKDYTPFNEGHRELIPSEENLSGCITNALAKDSLLSNNQTIRRLTPLECERLQGFPDGWTKGISDTQRYKCLGNAVTVNVIEAIGRAWIRYEN